MTEVPPESIEELRAENERLRKINRSLMRRVERTLDRNSAFSLFEDATNLENEARQRSAALHAAMRELTHSNAELIAARDAAHAASQAKSEFLARMSHEIRTPMNGVMGITELLLGTEVTEHQRFLLGTVQRSAEALLQIIDDILDFTKIEAGRLALESIEFDPAATVRDTVELLREIATRKGIELVAEVASDVPRCVLGDPLRLRQVLTNLIGNAFKFTAQGHVRVSARIVDDRDGAVMLRFEVEDTGIGIPPEAHVRVFESFAQADGSTTRRYGGTGLGLAIVRQLTTLMGGEVGLSSTPGIGSTFWFTIRLTRTTGSVAGATSALVPVVGAASIRGMHVLVAEDNPTNREVLCGMLDRLGCTYAVVADGRAAIDAAFECRPDIVLMDWQMPELDGLAAAREIRRLEEQRGLPRRSIVAVTANAMDSDRTRCLEAGMDDFISKPFRLAGLLQVLVRVARHDRAPREAVVATVVPASELDVAVTREIIELDPSGKLFERVLRTYLADAAELGRSIREGLAAARWTEVRDAAHRLKSSSGYVGALRLSAMCEHAEHAARSADASALAGMIDELVDEHARVCVAVDGELERRVRPVAQAV